MPSIVPLITTPIVAEHARPRTRWFVSGAYPLTVGTSTIPLRVNDSRAIFRPWEHRFPGGADDVTITLAEAPHLFEVTFRLLAYEAATDSWREAQARSGLVDVTLIKNGTHALATETWPRLGPTFRLQPISFSATPQRFALEIVKGRGR